jgi:hypothetical protein
LGLVRGSYGPTNSISGYLERRDVDIYVSTARSVSVTISAAERLVSYSFYDLIQIYFYDNSSTKSDSNFLSTLSSIQIRSMIAIFRPPGSYMYNMSTDYHVQFFLVPVDSVLGFAARIISPALEDNSIR